MRTLLHTRMRMHGYVLPLAEVASWFNTSEPCCASQSMGLYRSLLLSIQFELLEKFASPIVRRIR